MLRTGHGDTPRPLCPTTSLELEVGRHRRRRWVRGPGARRPGGVRPPLPARANGSGPGSPPRPPPSSGPTPSRSSPRRRTGCAPVCPHAGPGRCGGCDFQHVALPAQRRLKEDLVAEQLSRLAGLELRRGRGGRRRHPAGSAWRTRVGFAVDPDGAVGLHRHRSHDIEPVGLLPDRHRRGQRGRRGLGRPGRGARQLEVLASPDGGPAGGPGRDRQAAPRRPARPRCRPGVEGPDAAGPRTTSPSRSVGDRFEVRAGVFWQVHPEAAADPDPRGAGGPGGPTR